MTHILHVQSSSNLANSATRSLSDDFVASYGTSHPDVTVTTRDLVTTPMPHLGVDLLGGLFGKPEALTSAQQAALALSDTLLAEIAAADLLVLAVPMYNFGVPSAFKAWIDHVLRAGRTFRYTPTGPEGLLTGKRAVLVLANDGNYAEAPSQALDFLEPYLRAILRFIGITDIAVIRAQGLAMGPDATARAMAQAHAQSLALAA